MTRPTTWLTRSRSLVLAIAVSVGLMACGGAASSSATGTSGSNAPAAHISIGLGANSLTFGPLLLADAGGFFRKQNLDVNLVVTGSGAKTFPAVLSGNTQFGGIVLSDSITAAKQGQDVVNISVMMGQYGSNMVVSKKFADAHGITKSMTWKQKAAKMKGARVAVSGIGSGDDKLWEFVLKQGGLDPARDVQITAIAGSDPLLAAIKANRIDAFAIGAPAPDEAVYNGDAISFAQPSTGEIAPLAGFTYTTLAVNKAYLKENPGVVQRVVNAVTAALQLVHTNSKKAESLLYKKYFSTLPSGLMDKMWAANKSAFPATGEITKKGVQENISFLGISDPPKTSVFVDNSFASKPSK